MSAAVFAVPRQSLVWMLLAFTLAIIPHYGQMPIWLFGVALLCVIWRLMVYFERWRFPGKITRFALVIGGLVGIFIHFGTIVGPEAGVALLVYTVSLKLIEMHKRRDAYVALVLMFFVVSTHFLFSSHILLAMYLTLVSGVVTCALISLNDPNGAKRAKSTVLFAGTLMLKAAPLTLAIFILLPRLPPLWQLQPLNDKGTTGISDEVSPGDIAELSQSADLAFRIKFKGTEPGPEAMYWRGPVFDYFDGRTWRLADESMPIASPVHWYGEPAPAWYRQLGYNELAQRNRFNTRYEYEVTLEPTQQRWLFAMRGAALTYDGAGYTRDHRIITEDTIDEVIKYSVRSTPSKLLDPYLPNWLRVRNTQLPSRGDLQARQFALQHFNRLGRDPKAYIDFLLQYFHEQPFHYTLKPPLLGRDTIDEFLFESKKGFCAHYSSVFIFLMRAAGVPARMVGGYQGGELNPMGLYYLVHQFDAHVWAEVWLEDQGWVRVDPTAAVAPERVEEGLEAAVRDEASFLSSSPLSPLRFRNNGVISRIRHTLDYINYAWHKNVVGYTADRQLMMMRNWFGNVSLKQMGVALVVIACGIMAIIAWITFRRKPTPDKDPINELYKQVLSLLSKKGLMRQSSETPEQFLQRVKSDAPEDYPMLNDITERYSKLKYQTTADKKVQRTLKTELEQLIKTASRSEVVK